jgi:hypothetical protein
MRLQELFKQADFDKIPEKQKALSEKVVVEK